MDSRYLESVINRDGQHVVLGRRLHPYCLNDILLLTADNNPIVCGEGSPDWGHLVVAVLVCSTPAAEFISPRLGGVWRWLYVVWLTWRYKRHLAREAAKFAAYVDDYFQPPEFWTSDEGRTSRAPWILSVAAFIEDHSNMTEAEIMTAPAGKMLWKSAALAEHQGSETEIVSETDQQAMKELGLKP